MQIETLYEEKVQGILVRSRALWHEHGEKNSKYFFSTWKKELVQKSIFGNFE